LSEDRDKAKQDARNRLVGRAMVIGLLLLVLAYVLATFVR
jgi:hypothetical protein